MKLSRGFQICSISLVLSLLIIALAQSPADAQVTPPQRTVTVMQFNVGNADAGCPPKSFVPVDKLRLNNPDDIARIRSLIGMLRPDVVLLQETKGRAQLVDPNNPVLPPGYDGRCPVDGSKGDGMGCVAWRVKAFDTVGPEACQGKFVFGEGWGSNGIVVKGGFAKCTLSKAGSPVQFVSSYIPFVGKNGTGQPEPLRAEVLSILWESNFFDKAAPAVVGGDFNTEDCTGKHQSAADCSVPYPANFGTLFGRNAQGYGRWSPSSTYFGHTVWNDVIEKHITQRVKVCGLTVSRGNFDHIFANFGTPEIYNANFGTQKYFCGGSSCLIGEDSFTVPEEMWCESCDHMPIVTKLSW